jgi:hypothetical protein
MAISTYAELQTAVAGWLHRSDLTTQIPDFITLAESRINRKLALLLQETEATLTATPASRAMAVPTRFASPLGLWLTTYEPRQALGYMLPTHLPVTDEASESVYYTVNGSNIETENPADQAYTYLLRYFINFDIAATSTNSLLDAYPDIYLYGTLLESAPYLQDTTAFQIWENRFEVAVREATRESNRTKSRAPLRTDVPGSYGNGNIIRGY